MTFVAAFVSFSSVVWALEKGNGQTRKTDNILGLRTLLDGGYLFVGDGVSDLITGGGTEILLPYGEERLRSATHSLTLIDLHS